MYQTQTQNNVTSLCGMVTLQQYHIGSKIDEAQKWLDVSPLAKIPLDNKKKWI